MKRLTVALLGFALVANAEEPRRAAINCRGFSEKEFCCIAINVEKFKPTWQIYDDQEPDRSEGQSACFVAPREWRTIEMRVVDDAGTKHVVRALVRRDLETKRILFAQAESPE